MPSLVGSCTDSGEHCARDLTLARVDVVAQVDKIWRGGQISGPGWRFFVRGRDQGVLTVVRKDLLPGERGLHQGGGKA